MVYLVYETEYGKTQKKKKKRGIPNADSSIACKMRPCTVSDVSDILSFFSRLVIWKTIHFAVVAFGPRVPACMGVTGCSCDFTVSSSFPVLAGVPWFSALVQWSMERSRFPFPNAKAVVWQSCWAVTPAGQVTGLGNCRSVRRRDNPSGIHGSSVGGESDYTEVLDWEMQWATLSVECMWNS